MLSSELYFPNLSVTKLSNVSASFRRRSMMPIKFPACSMAQRIMSSRCSEAKRCWRGKKKRILGIKSQDLLTFFFFFNCTSIPACWSLHRGCKTLPGNRRPPQSPRHFDSHRSTPLCWCGDRSGRCLRGSPLSSQVSSCRSSGACSSCTAVGEIHVFQRTDMLRHAPDFNLFFSTTYPASYLPLWKLCSESL